jgi:hypothetical protein
MNRVHRKANGVYKATLPGVGAPGGNVQVNNEDGFNGDCHVVGFRQRGADEVVNVRCHRASGALWDSPFYLAFTDGQGLKSPGSRGVAYLKADKPTSPNYAPDPRYAYQSNGASPTIAQSNTGRYVVTLPGMEGGGAAQVTTYGFGNARCQVSHLADSGRPVKIGVDCNYRDGTPANTIFGLQYTV